MTKRFEGTQDYVATDDLKIAVNASIALERPLLIKGEPGTGKTMLAEEVAGALGLRMLLRPRREWPQPGAAMGAQGLRASGLRGLLTNLLNPKVGVFYVSFLPQFVPHGVWPAGFLFLLACVHVLLTLAWFGVLIAATAPIGRWLARERVMRALDRCTGLVFLGFGARLAWERPL